MKYKTFMLPSAMQPSHGCPLSIRSRLSLPHASTISLQELMGTCLDLHNTPLKCTVHKSSTSSRDPHVCGINNV
ncbi:hypothetical protein E2C01_042782 [Portunus trituberculatus]|uniref:Uncharacterized protein n=1 Tax=Portunus trituberculatus TaxID=210409 RepID=A0A5B7FUH9_PORTR|nr:hypothetical protein [Portunus trituberculatus]